MNNIYGRNIAPMKLCTSIKHHRGHTSADGLVAACEIYRKHNVGRVKFNVHRDRTFYAMNRGAKPVSGVGVAFLLWICTQTSPLLDAKAEVEVMVWHRNKRRVG